MKKTLLTLLTFSLVLAAQAIEIPIKHDSTKKTKWTLNLTGRIDAAFYTDSYANIDSRNGLQYMMPVRPNYDPVTGKDLNAYGQFRFNAVSSRLGISTNVKLSDKVNVDAVVETDFMGSSNSDPLSLRLRHAFIRVNMGNSSLLFGQTCHLAMVDQISPSTVTYGGGFPINIQARPVQIQFAQQIGMFNLAAAVSMYPDSFGAMQSYAMTPDVSLRLMVGDPKRNMIGVVGGFKSIMPKMASVADKMARVNSFYGALFGRATIADGYAIRAYAIYGGDLTPLGLTGGFAPLKDNLGYTPITTVSAWIDFSTPKYAGFEFGIFGGYQQNLGTATDIDIANASAGQCKGLQNFWRVAPRVWYHYKMLSFGFEYMYSQAVWAHQIDDRYFGSLNFAPTRDNRYTLLARFTF